MNPLVIVTAASKADALLAAAGATPDLVVLGDAALAARLAPGAASVRLLETGERPVEAFAPAVAALAVAAAPRVVVAGTTAGERALAGAVAGALRAPILTAVTGWQADADATVVDHTALGGLVAEQVRIEGPVVVVIDAAGSAPAPAGDPAAVEPVTGETFELSVTDHARDAAAGVDLARASRVVAAGRGLKRSEDLALIEQLAQRLQAEVGCSRPLAEGLNWLPTDRYIGVSGQKLAPRLYVACGISGQLQHMVGVRDSDVIVAFEQNAEAPIVAQSDYTVLGDMYATIPAVIEELAR